MAAQRVHIGVQSRRLLGHVGVWLRYPPCHGSLMIDVTGADRAGPAERARYYAGHLVRGAATKILRSDHG